MTERVILIRSLVLTNSALCYIGAFRARGNHPYRLLYCAAVLATGKFGLGFVPLGGTVILQALGVINGALTS